jgi:hypothetical protein
MYIQSKHFENPEQEIVYLLIVSFVCISWRERKVNKEFMREILSKIK